MEKSERNKVKEPASKREREREREREEEEEEKACLDIGREMP